MSTFCYHLSMATLHVRIDSDIKKKAQKILSDIGLDMSTAVNMYFYKIVMNEGIPFDVQRERYVPDHIMEEWEREAQEALKHGKRYASAKELHADIIAEMDEEDKNARHVPRRRNKTL